MIQFSAPYPLLTTTIMLPNPLLGDLEGGVSSIITKRSMDGTLYTYVQKNTDKKLELQFLLTRLKGEEFKRFLFTYASDKLIYVDYLARTWVGYITSNPIEFTTSRRGAPGGGNELMEVSIEFEGEIQ